MLLNTVAIFDRKGQFYEQTKKLKVKLCLLHNFNTSSMYLQSCKTKAAKLKKETVLQNYLDFVSRQTGHTDGHTGRFQYTSVDIHFAFAGV